MNDRAKPEWAALSLAVNKLLQRAAMAQGLIHQHEFLPADDDAQRIEDALQELVGLARNARLRCVVWRAVQS